MYISDKSYLSSKLIQTVLGLFFTDLRTEILIVFHPIEEKNRGKKTSPKMNMGLELNDAANFDVERNKGNWEG